MGSGSDHFMVNIWAKYLTRLMVHATRGNTHMSKSLCGVKAKQFEYQNDKDDLLQTDDKVTFL